MQSRPYTSVARYALNYIRLLEDYQHTHRRESGDFSGANKTKISPACSTISREYIQIKLQEY